MFPFNKSRTSSATMIGIKCLCSSGCSGDDYDSENATCDLKPGGMCFSAIETNNYFTQDLDDGDRSYGCISDPYSAVLQCKGDLVPSRTRRSIKCCNFTDLCNQNLLVRIKPLPIQQRSDKLLPNAWLYLAIGIVSIIAVLLFIIRRFYKYRKQNGSHDRLTTTFDVEVQKSHPNFDNCITSSGSGAGKPLLGQATMARRINRIMPLGGQFYLGEFNGGKIVEKIFDNEEKYNREKRFYESPLTRHKYILGYFLSDMSNGHLVLYFDYHHYGSLYDYLDKAILDRTKFFKLISSAVLGVAYLHMEIHSTVKRPAICHCNINSKNFLVNDDGECVLHNFEYCVKPESTDIGVVDEYTFDFSNARYLAPELINGSAKLNCISDFKKLDIYALGLVLYEICQRYATFENNTWIVDEHQMPFSDILPKFASLQDMRELFALKKPLDLLVIPKRWENDISTLNPFSKVLRECFYDERPGARPESIRIKKRISELENKIIKSSIII